MGNFPLFLPSFLHLMRLPLSFYGFFYFDTYEIKVLYIVSLLQTDFIYIEFWNRK